MSPSSNPSIWLAPLLFLLCWVAPIPLAAAAEALDQAALERYQAHYDRGVALYKQEHYAEAIPELMAAYEIKQLPRLLFNIGQAHRQLGHSREALSYYERYLALDVDIQPDERARVEALIATTRALLQGASPPPPAPPPVAPPAPPPEQPRRFHMYGWSWVGLAISLGAGAAASVTGTMALNASNALLNTTHAGPEDYQAGQERVRTLALTTDALIGGAVGIFAVTLTATLIVSYAPRGKARAPRTAKAAPLALIAAF